MTSRYDLIVVGSGIAGLFTAVKAAQHGRVALITKAALEESNTRYAQGGIAAAMFPDDSAELHMADTLSAGAGLCNEDAVRVLCSEGPERIYELLSYGVQFDRVAGDLVTGDLVTGGSVNGEFQRGLEAAHSRARVLHAGGDATGARVELALAHTLRSNNVDVYEHAYLLDLVVEGGVVDGVSLLDNNGQALELRSGATVLATGGAGRLYSHTTNPGVATGDGAAAAFRAGALIADSEFYQFHPTALAQGDTFLVSEAVRGEGAVLRNAQGEAFMERYDKRADLAPRDVVARAIANEMHQQDGTPVVLDATSMSREFLTERFPTISSHLQSISIDWSRQLVPVTPAAHYWMGGIRTDTWGRTSLAGLYAVGEVACTGIHGANRLASNSLLEGIVFGGRVVRYLIAPEKASDPSLTNGHLDGPSFSDDTYKLPAVTGNPIADVTKADVQALMWDKAGLVRNEDDLRVAAKQLGLWSSTDMPDTPGASEIRNLVTVGRILISAALARQESRGAHFRSDYPATTPEWAKHMGFVC